MLKDQNESSMGTKGTLGNFQATWGHSPPEKEYNMIQPTKKVSPRTAPPSNFLNKLRAM